MTPPECVVMQLFNDSDTGDEGDLVKRFVEGLALEISQWRSFRVFDAVADFYFHFRKSQPFFYTFFVGSFNVGVTAGIHGL